MWILADLLFLVGFTVSAVTVAALLESVHTKWYDHRNPCTCKPNAKGTFNYQNESRENCERHNTASFRHFDTMNIIAIFCVIVTAFVATLELHRMFAWWH